MTELCEVRPRTVYVNQKMPEYLHVLWPNGDHEVFKSIHKDQAPAQDPMVPTCPAVPSDPMCEEPDCGCCDKYLAMRREMLRDHGWGWHK